MEVFSWKAGLIVKWTGPVRNQSAHVRKAQLPGVRGAERWRHAIVEIHLLGPLQGRPTVSRTDSLTAKLGKCLLKIRQNGGTRVENVGAEAKRTAFRDGSVPRETARDLRRATETADDTR
jgi:hypothetical protein